MMKIGILGVPFNGDGTRPEIENPAAALRQAGLSSLKFFSGNTMVNYGDLQIPVFDDHRDPKTNILHFDRQIFREMGADNLAN